MCEMFLPCPDRENCSATKMTTIALAVSSEMIETLRDWSPPVQVRAVRHDSEWTLESRLLTEAAVKDAPKPKPPPRPEPEEEQRERRVAVHAHGDGKCCHTDPMHCCDW